MCVCVCIAPAAAESYLHTRKPTITHRSAVFSADRGTRANRTIKDWTRLESASLSGVGVGGIEDSLPFSGSRGGQPRRSEKRVPGGLSLSLSSRPSLFYSTAAARCCCWRDGPEMFQLVSSPNATPFYHWTPPFFLTWESQMLLTLLPFCLFLFYSPLSLPPPSSSSSCQL